ncbi:MAG: hypothetical protein SFX74_13300 [Fimbriimonadaceae bacterium]|nr:hypothetical protein [Fimbriimonadaceae bacterium]
MSALLFALAMTAMGSPRPAIAARTVRPAEPVLFRVSGKVGQERRTEMKAAITAEKDGESVEIKINIITLAKLTAIDPNGDLRLNVITERFELTVMGETVEQEADPVEVVLSPRNETRPDPKADSEALDVTSQADMRDWVFPEAPKAIGDRWTDIRKGTKKKSDVQFDFVFDRREVIGDFDCYVWKIASRELKEGGMVCEETVWFDRDDTSVVKSEATVRNGQYSGVRFTEFKSTQVRI